jgi:hypothetical protein
LVAKGVARLHLEGVRRHPHRRLPGPGPFHCPIRIRVDIEAGGIEAEVEGIEVEGIGVEGIEAEGIEVEGDEVDGIEVENIEVGGVEAGDNPVVVLGVEGGVEGGIDLVEAGAEAVETKFDVVEAGDSIETRVDLVEPGDTAVEPGVDLVEAGDTAGADLVEGFVDLTRALALGVRIALALLRYRQAGQADWQHPGHTGSSQNKSRVEILSVHIANVSKYE